MTVIPPSFVTIKTVHGVEVVETRVSLVDALSLELQAIHVSSLSFSPIHPTEFYLLLSPLTSKRMPFLEELNIVVQQPSDPKAPYLNVPAITLPSSNFLLLETLRLDGVNLTMSAPFLPSLRHLVLANYPSIEQRVPFTDFMAALESCSNLEELEIRRYGRIFSFHEAEPAQPAMLNQLKKLTIDEPSVIVMNMLEQLCVPATADVHVTLDYRHAFADQLQDLHDGLAYIFSVIIPTRHNTLPIREQVTSVEAEFGPCFYRIVGETPLANKLTFEILLDPEMGGVFAPKSLMDPLDRTFSISPVMCASFTGDLSGLTGEHWVIGLGSLPLLMKLIVNHTADAPTRTATALFNALVPFPWPEGTMPEFPPLVPELENLCVQGATYDTELLGRVHECLEERAAQGVALHSLWLEMRTSKSELDGCLAEIARVTPDLTALTVTGSCHLRPVV
ncbi:hypothetical protein PYCCODRAFT_1457875 [Trametes coccinea BRFM310]|uniref:F-box domain-containing protein n=1 Tax=Trametes coccinea (strain BRFM310) TaxID=1353009 RepID=A0A1Y2ITM5_TRAC3|nr:hypothetical protein PYCCODRAFT_1457875 [Trametes coccinea BRFM310]